MRRAKQAEIDNKPKPDELTFMSARIKTLEKLVGQLVQYQKDHDELHRLMAKKSGELERTVAQAITTSQQDLRAGIETQGDYLNEALQSQRQGMMATLAVIQKALEEFSGKEIEINIPEQPELVLLDYEIVRGANNLLSKIREVKQ